MRFTGPYLHEEGCRCNGCRQKREYVAMFQIAVAAAGLFVVYAVLRSHFPAAVGWAWRAIGFAE
jgi:hypothetical protein